MSRLQSPGPQGSDVELHGNYHFKIWQNKIQSFAKNTEEKA